MNNRLIAKLIKKGIPVIMALLLAASMLPALSVRASAEEILPEEQRLDEWSDEIELEEVLAEEADSEGAIVILEAQEAAQAADAEGVDYDGFLVRFADGAVSEKEMHQADNCEPVEFAENLCYAGTVEDVLEEFDSEQIESIEPNYILSLCDADLLSASDPDDPAYQEGKQNNLSMVKVESAWKYGLDGRAVSGKDPVVVAMIDTGVNLLHEDLTADSVVSGHRWHADDPDDIVDWHGHGSLSSSLLIACKDNGIGSAGMMPQVKVMPLSIFYQYEKDSKTYVGANIADLISAINYAAENGADVINMSLGDKKISQNLQDACDNAISKGAILIAAAGNEGIDSPEYPASFDNVIGVGSVGTYSDAYAVSTFSERGKDNVFCTAPGYQIYGMGHKTSSSYSTKNGTSFSSPQVAALAAMVKSIDRSITQEKFMQLLIDTCYDLGDKGRDDDFGYGLIDFGAMIKAVEKYRLSIGESSFELPTKKTHKITARVTSNLPYTPSVTWKSSDENIATVDKNGVVTAIRYGTAEITAALNVGKKIIAKCRVQTRYYDVADPSFYYYEPIYWAADNGIASGNDNVFFSPNGICTRKQMMILLWQFAGSPEVTGKMKFPDVTYGKNSASYKAILWGCTTGIVCGNEEGLFLPNTPVTRKQAIIMLYRFSGSPAVRGKMKFKDVTASVNSATYKSIVWGKKNKLINGYPDKTFRPDEKCLRKQIVTFLYRYKTN